MQHNDTRFLELLQRWQSGDFTRADEQELNTLAASDDFRREALEGFMSQPEAAHEERLAALRLRLQKRVGGGRWVALPQMLAAAAVLVLLLAAIWFFPQWNQNDSAPVAQAQENAAGDNPVHDSAASDQGIGYNQPQEPSVYSKSAPAAGPSRSATSDKDLSSQGIASGDVVAAEESAAFDPQDDAASNYSAVPQQTPSAAPPIVPSEVAASRPAVTDMKKERATDNVSGRMAESAKAKKSNAPGRADSTWHETDRKPDMAAEKKAARNQAEPKESEPEGGWDAFSDYLRQNARLTPEARNHNTSGTVQLQFNLNNNGDPQGFVVLRSLGYGCDQEAIRLVQNWEWVRGVNPIVTVEVPFVR